MVLEQAQINITIFYIKMTMIEMRKGIVVFLL